MKVFVIVSLLFIVSIVSAQENIVSSGGEATGSGGDVSYTIGQIDYQYFSGSSGSLNEGVQQPYEFYIVGTDASENITLDVIAFPNPTQADVSLQFSNLKDGIKSYSLFDLSGKLMLNERIVSSRTQIPFNKYPSGTYILSVVDQNEILKTFKIIKY